MVVYPAGNGGQHPQISGKDGIDFPFRHRSAVDTDLEGQRRDLQFIHAPILVTAGIQTTLSDQRISGNCQHRLSQGFGRSIQKESDAQMLLEAKGFAQSVVSISGDCADVMVEASSLTQEQTAQIIDIVQRKTEVAPENIIITVSGAQ